MKADELSSDPTLLETNDLLSPLLQTERTSPAISNTASENAMQPGAHPIVVAGRLLALTDGGCTPLVSFDGQPQPGAMPARSVVDLRPAHVGLEVLLLFHGGDRARPIVTGVFRGQAGWPLEQLPGRVKVDVDGERLTVVATRELVLRCGKAVLTLHSDGRIELRGEEIVSQAAGAHRIRGGSVELN